MSWLQCKLPSTASFWSWVYLLLHFLLPFFLRNFSKQTAALLESILFSLASVPMYIMLFLLEMPPQPWQKSDLVFHGKSFLNSFPFPLPNYTLLIYIYKFWYCTKCSIITVGFFLCIPLPALWSWTNPDIRNWIIFFLVYPASGVVHRFLKSYLLFFACISYLSEHSYTSHLGKETGKEILLQRAKWRLFKFRTQGLEKNLMSQFTTSYFLRFWLIGERGDRPWRKVSSELAGLWVGTLYSAISTPGWV